MRTTLDLDDLVLAAARSLAQARGMSLGAAVSELARRGLEVGRTTQVDTTYAPFPVLIGDPEHVVTPALVNQFRDDE